ncbi:MAG: Matrixin [Verrucomicrobiaceae bacterium]|nr:Matrixin [Verrucomicrobiaceae bacterium]
MQRTDLLIISWLLASAATLQATDPLPVLTVPVRVHLMQSVTQARMNTTLTDTDVQRIFGKVNKVWSQAGIHFDPEPLLKTTALEVSANEKLKNEFERLKASLPPASHSSKAINVCYVKMLEPNGFYFAGDVFVKDTASLKKVAGGLDEPIPRVTAHELGHALGLKHRQNVTNLMASGTTGFSLNEEEIKTARNAAAMLLQPKMGAKSVSVP